MKNNILDIELLVGVIYVFITIVSIYSFYGAL